MSGRTIAADEAIELGIVYRILDSDRLLDEALNLAKSFRDTGEAALKTIKKQFRRLRSADSSVPDGAVVERQIRAVMNRYCRGVDRGDIDLIKSTYWDDAYDDHGSFKGSPKDFAEAVTTRMDGVGLVGQHHVTNMTVVLDGDIARVEAYYLAFTPEFDHQSGEAVIKLIIGRYLDRYEKRCGEWRVANRLTLVDWAQPYQDGTPWNRSDLFTRGDRREADPSHLFLR